MKATPNTMILRERHHLALERLDHSDRHHSGLALWRKLRRIEAEANRVMTDYCNGDLDCDAVDVECERFEDRVRKILGRVPVGFFINRDPRGYALKLQPGSCDAPLHEDWGRYQILAPTIP